MDVGEDGNDTEKVGGEVLKGKEVVIRGLELKRCTQYAAAHVANPC